MKNLVIVALLASTASMVAWALPPQPATTVNYCTGGQISSSTVVHANMTHYTYTSGAGCVISANRVLSLSGDALYYTEANNTNPVIAEFVSSRVEEGGALNIQAPEFGFLNLMVPWVVRVTNNAFAKNAVLHFHGCLPASSVMTISGNTFAGQTARNYGVDYDGIAAMSFGQLDPNFVNPLYFAPNSEVVIADNVVSDVVGAMGFDTSGIRVVPASFFLGDHSKLILRNNSVSVTGTSSNPAIPYNIKGYINVIPEYQGNSDVTFEFSDNAASVTNGLAWWMPGMWGPRGATDLKVNILRNRGTVSTIVNNEKYAALQSIVNCTARGQFVYEGNEVRVSGGEGRLVFHDQLSEDHSVRITNNVFQVSGGDARVMLQPWTGVKSVEFSGNAFGSDDHNTNLEFAGINGTNLAGTMNGNALDGTVTYIAIAALDVKGGKLSFGQTVMTSRYGDASVNIPETRLDDAEVDLSEWAVTATHAVTASFARHLALENSKLHFRDSNFSASRGNCILNFANSTLTGGAILNVSKNRIEAAAGTPHVRFTDDLKASDESAALMSFNYLYRTDRAGSATMPFMYVTGDVEIEDRAELGLWNNTFDTRNNTNFVGLLTVAGNVTVGDDALVGVCNNKYYVVTNETMVLMAVAPGLAARSDCSKYATTTPAPSTTGASTTLPAGSDSASNVTAPDSNITTLFPATTTTGVNNGAPSGAAVGIALAAMLASVLALLQ